MPSKTQNRNFPTAADRAVLYPSLSTSPLRYHPRPPQVQPQPTMLSTTRTLLPSLSRPTTITTPLLRGLRLYSTADRTSDRIPTNDPNPPAPAQNVSESNAVPTTAAGNFDAAIQEFPEDAERQRRMQAPNRARPWSRSQAERALAMSGPRFEQTIMELQVCDWDCGTGGFVLQGREVGRWRGWGSERGWMGALPVLTQVVGF